MKSRVMKLTESQLRDLITKTVKKVLTENPIESESFNFPYTKEDLYDWDMSGTYGDKLFIYFNNPEDENDEIIHEFDVDHRITYYTPGEEQSWDNPGSGPELEVGIDSVKQIEPFEKEIPVNEFEDVLKHLGIYDDIIERIIKYQKKKMKDDEESYWDDVYHDMQNDDR